MMRKLHHEGVAQVEVRVVARLKARGETWRLRGPEALLLWERDTRTACQAGADAAAPSTSNGGANGAGGAGPTAPISGTASWTAPAALVWGAVLTVSSGTPGVGTVPATVTVDPNGAFRITVTRVAAGTTTITITGPGSTASDTVDVTFT